MSHEQAPIGPTAEELQRDAEQKQRSVDEQKKRIRDRMYDTGFANKVVSEVVTPEKVAQNESVKEYVHSASIDVMKFTDVMALNGAPGAKKIPITEHQSPALKKPLRYALKRAWAGKHRADTPISNATPDVGWDLGSKNMKNQYALMLDGRIVKKNPPQYDETVQQSPNIIVLDPNNPAMHTDPALQQEFFDTMQSIGLKTPDDFKDRLDEMAALYSRDIPRTPPPYNTVLKNPL